MFDGLQETNEKYTPLNYLAKSCIPSLPAGITIAPETQVGGFCDDQIRSLYRDLLRICFGFFVFWGGISILFEKKKSLGSCCPKPFSWCQIKTPKDRGGLFRREGNVINISFRNKKDL